MAIISLEPNYWDKFIRQYGNNPINLNKNIREFNLLERTYFNFCTLHKGVVVYTFDNQINFEKDGVFWVGGFDTYKVVGKPFYFIPPSAFRTQKEAISCFVEGATIECKYWNSVFNKYCTDILYFCEIYQSIELYLDHIKDKEIKFLKCCKPKQRKLIEEILKRLRGK